MNVPSHLDAHTELVVSGVGGEAAHGLYIRGSLDGIDQLPVEAQVDAYVSTNAWPTGRTLPARARSLAPMSPTR